MSQSPERVAALADRIEINDVLSTYAHGVDKKDGALVLACFHDDATFEIGEKQMPVGQFFQMNQYNADGLQATMHLITNVLVEIRGDVANTQCYLLAYHLVGAEGPDRPPLFPCSGKDYGLLVGGHYVDRFERRDGSWRIAQRRLAFEWTANLEGPRGCCQTKIVPA
jgi:hypothetical protein